MQKSRKYSAATAIAIFAVVLLMTWASRRNITEAISDQPTRTPAAELEQLANFTRIRVEGDFALELTQVQDYTIEYVPLSANEGELAARVENDTLIVEGFGNRSDTSAAVLSIGVPVLDTLDVVSVPEITVSNFNSPVMNIRLNAFDTFTMRNSVIGNLDLVSLGSGAINLEGNTLTTQNLDIEEGSDLNISD